MNTTYVQLHAATKSQHGACGLLTASLGLSGANETYLLFSVPSRGSPGFVPLTATVKQHASSIKSLKFVLHKQWLICF